MAEIKLSKSICTLYTSVCMYVYNMCIYSYMLDKKGMFIV